MTRSKRQLLHDILSEVIHLHLYANGVSPHKLRVKKGAWKWTLPVSCVQDMLECIGPRKYLRKAVIDGYEPLLDEKRLTRLMACLNLHYWIPTINTTGAFMKISAYPMRIIQRLVQTGYFEITLYLNAARMHRIGPEAINRLYRAIHKHGIKMTVCYQLEKNNTSRLWLQRLLACHHFNNIISAAVHITPLISYKTECAPRRAGIDTNQFFPELIVGHEGTLCVYLSERSRHYICSLLDRRWQQTLSDWFSGEYANARI